MTLTMLGSLVGGVGLFLLGMWLMTNGLKVAAGQALRNILAHGTRTPVRGLLSGALITSLVQSSSAVTVATIGFVNAGLMSLAQAVTVIYGSNIGTTVTGWLVAATGFDINIKAFALPAVGVGMLLRSVYPESRRGAFGEALVGFGVFFLGIEVLKSTFVGVGQGMPLAEMGGGGVGGTLVFAGIGFLLTVIMQSSSAALAVTLTAAAGGVIPLNSAAAAVIGANVGTTSTAALAVLGATPNAKRVAAAHVAFNLITGVVALAVMPLLLFLLVRLRELLTPTAEPVVVLALFHTLFNLLGVLLLWPATRRLVRFLEGRFRSAEEDEARPRYLDHNVVGTPVLAMHALGMELTRIGAIAQRMAKGAISSELAPGSRLATDRAVLDRLVDAVGEFSSQVRRSHLPPELDEILPNALRVSRYYSEIAELAVAIAGAQGSSPRIEQPQLAEEIAGFKGSVVSLLDAADVRASDYSMEVCEERLKTLQDGYQHLKSGFLRAGTQGQVPVRQMVDQLDLLSNIRRIASQAEKGARYLADLRALIPVSARDAADDPESGSRTS